MITHIDSLQKKNARAAAHESDAKTSQEIHGGNKTNITQAKQRPNAEVNANEKIYQKKENNTGLPDNLKAGIENLSGLAMDDVKVHYNSSKPATLQAHAYAQGTDIHLAAGQEHHLPHEAWHVVQQKQGRVKPTMQMKGGVNINDDVGLEKEADVMGKRGIHMNNIGGIHQNQKSIQRKTEVIQRLVLPIIGTGQNVVFSQEDTQKKNELNKVLTDFGQNILPNQNWLLQITFDNDIDSNPADTIANANQQTIDINIRQWVLRKNDIGFILGMIAHEIGAHTLTDMEMTQNEQAQENNQNGQLFTKMISGNQYDLTPVNGGGGRQQDHINSAKVDLWLRNFSPRALHYLDTVVRLGNSIVNQNNGNVNGVIPQLTELIHTYLFDIARIIVDDDKNRPVKIVWDANQVADVMNWLNGILTRNAQYLPNPPVNNWLGNIAINETGNSIRWYLVQKLVGYGTAIIKHKWSGHL